MLLPHIHYTAWKLKIFFQYFFLVCVRERKTNKLQLCSYQLRESLKVKNFALTNLKPFELEFFTKILHKIEKYFSKHMFHTTKSYSFVKK